MDPDNTLFTMPPFTAGGRIWYASLHASRDPVERTCPRHRAAHHRGAHESPKAAVHRRRSSDIPVYPRAVGAYRTTAHFDTGGTYVVLTQSILADYTGQHTGQKPRIRTVKLTRNVLCCVLISRERVYKRRINGDIGWATMDQGPSWRTYPGEKTRTN